jgi:hypothetical protein
VFTDLWGKESLSLRLILALAIAFITLKRETILLFFSVGETRIANTKISERPMNVGLNTGDGYEKNT